MTQPAAPGPLSEADLRDQLRFDPVHARSGIARRFRIGAVVLAQRLDAFSKIMQGLPVEAGAQLTGILQSSVIVIAEQECTESAAAAA
jgi:hypothetical protein